MQITGKRKLILTIAAILVVVVIVILIFSSGKKTTGPASVTPTPIITPDDNAPYGVFPQNKSGVSVTAQATAGAASKASPSPTPARSQVIGMLDWSKNIKINQALPLTLSADVQDKIASNDPCYMTGLSDSWSNPFEKTLCGLERTVISQILDPLLSMACTFSASGLAANYGSNINAKIVNGQCMIEDRK